MWRSLIRRQVDQISSELHCHFPGRREHAGFVKRCIRNPEVVLSRLMEFFKKASRLMIADRINRYLQPLRSLNHLGGPVVKARSKDSLLGRGFNIELSMELTAPKVH